MVVVVVAHLHARLWVMVTPEEARNAVGQEDVLDNHAGHAVSSPAQKKQCQH